MCNLRGVGYLFMPRSLIVLKYSKDIVKQSRNSPSGSTDGLNDPQFGCQQN